MKLLVIGSGGREQALVWQLAQASHVTQMWGAAGNARMGSEPSTAVSTAEGGGRNHGEQSLRRGGRAGGDPGVSQRHRGFAPRAVRRQNGKTFSHVARPQARAGR